jgi:hypothetical protein
LDGKFVMFSGNAGWGWTALGDGAAVAVRVLMEGEGHHGGNTE